MRGKECVDRTRKLPVGITPACAGKRHIATENVVLYRDHPRMCGEKQLLLYRRNARLGSPPHVRGKGAEGAEPAVHHGITPACAGKRSFCPCLQRSCWDHPRMCGEKQGCNPCIDSPRGSPPHVRGKEIYPTVPYLPCGITPACAGKRPRQPHGNRLHGDHPRMCGEKYG